MITYLLLRNNKESGPYSLTELLQFGLKPYDLVWVNGKSAAWRYPGEVEELKEYAPMVEEQPFDRFFKKPGESKTEEPKAHEAFQPSTPQPQPFTPKKSVFVTMPSQAQGLPKTSAPAPIEKKPVPVVPEQTISITENPVAAEIKYSQPLDEIKEMYVKTLQQRKQRIANKAFLLQSLKKVAVILVIVGAGVLIGFTLKSSGDKKQVVADNINGQKEPAVTSELPQTTVTAPLIVDTGNEAETNTLETIPSTPGPTEKQPLFSTPVTNGEVKTVPVKPEPGRSPRNSEPPIVQKEVVIDEPSPGVAVDARTGERSRKIRNAGEESLTDAITESSKEPLTSEPKAVLKPQGGLSKLVSVKSNDYHVVAFGGIRNLQLTVYNDSKYLLDNVTVEVQYLKPSEQPLRTENVQFRSISPGGSMTIRMPDTNRGIKVLYKITNILSTQSAKETAGL